MPQVKQTSEEVMDSLTGHDEMAIAQHFGRTVAELVQSDPLALARALIFVTNRRKPEVNDDNARNVAMDLPFKQVMTYFVDADDESEESGKGEPVDEPQKPSLLTSAS